MKWRVAASQNSHSSESLRWSPSLKRARTPLGTPGQAKLRSLTREELSSYGIDLVRRPELARCKAEVKAVVELEGRLRARAGEFAARVAKEQMHLKGRLMLRRQEEEERRQIKLEIARYEHALREKKEMMDKQQKYQRKAQFFQRKAQDRQLNQIQTLRQSSLPKSESSNREVHVKKGLFHKRVAPRQQKSQQIKLKNSIYLDEQQQRVEEARQRLIQLQSAIQSVERLKQKC